MARLMLGTMSHKPSRIILRVEAIECRPPFYQESNVLTVHRHKTVKTRNDSEWKVILVSLLDHHLHARRHTLLLILPDRLPFHSASRPARRSSDRHKWIKMPAVTARPPERLQHHILHPGLDLLLLGELARLAAPATRLLPCPQSEPFRDGPTLNLRRLMMVSRQRMEGVTAPDRIHPTSSLAVPV